MLQSITAQGVASMPKKKQVEHLELNDVLEESETIQRYKAERQRRHDHSDVQFYACLVFQSKDQKDEFLASISEDVPCLYGMYIDGQTFAEHVGLPVTPNECPPLKRPFNKKLAEMVKENELRQ
jgi:hypothetical protein